MAAMVRRVLACVVAVAAGCGPVSYVNQVTQGAASSVDAAREAQAEKYAPYYWVRANEYLRMAREDVARADFQGAIKFGKLSREAGDKAQEEAELAKKDPSRMPIDATHAGPAPAKAKELAPAKADE